MSAICPGAQSGSKFPKPNLSAGSEKSSISHNSAHRLPAAFPMDPPLAGPTHLKWPGDFLTCEIIDGFTHILMMMDDDPKMTEKTAHPLMLHGNCYVKATVCKVKSILQNSPASLRTTFMELGDVKEALWGTFTTAVKNYQPDTNDKGKRQAISVSESSTSGTETDDLILDLMTWINVHSVTKTCSLSPPRDFWLCMSLSRLRASTS
jgi:hypothetical protein